MRTSTSGTLEPALMGEAEAREANVACAAEAVDWRMEAVGVSLRPRPPRPSGARSRGRGRGRVRASYERGGVGWGGVRASSENKGMTVKMGQAEEEGEMPGGKDPQGCQRKTDSREKVRSGNQGNPIREQIDIGHPKEGGCHRDTAARIRSRLRLAPTHPSCMEQERVGPVRGGSYCGYSRVSHRR